jgi:hypothetical protein
MSLEGERAGGHRRFGGSRSARPSTAPPHRSTQPRPVGRRLRNLAAPPGSATTTQHGMAAHGNSGSGHGDLLETRSSASTRTGSTTNCSQTTIGPVARFPIGVPDPSAAAARALPAHPTGPAQPKRRCAPRWVRSMLLIAQPPVPPALGGRLGRVSRRLVRGGCRRRALQVRHQPHVTASGWSGPAGWV